MLNKDPELAPAWVAALWDYGRAKGRGQQNKESSHNQSRGSQGESRGSQTANRGSRNLRSLKCKVYVLLVLK